MSDQKYETTNLVTILNEVADKFQGLINYVYDKSNDNKFLRNRRIELIIKVTHGIILIESIKNFSTKLRGKEIEDISNFSLILTKHFGFLILLLWEIYSLMYKNWLKFIVEPSIIHRDIYTPQKLLDELKGKKVFNDPSQIKIDTHEIARRVTKEKNEFDSYISYLPINVLSKLDNLVYLSYNKDKYVNVAKADIDGASQVDFKTFAEAIEILTVWRAQYAHCGDYLFSCEEMVSEFYNKKSPEKFTVYNSKIFGHFSSKATVFVKYFERLFFELGEIIKIQNNSFVKIDEIFNYHIAPDT